MSTALKNGRGPRLPFAKLGGVWTELAMTYRLQKEGSLAPEDAKARCYVLQTMLGVVDRVLEQRVVDQMQDEIALLRAAVVGSGKPLPGAASMALVPARSAHA